MVSIAFYEYGSIGTTMLDTRYNVNTNGILTAFLTDLKINSVETVLLGVGIAVHSLIRIQ